ncbi:hypothetical protein CEUSTIGMA_g891.t1 [Chlamydomonas eustigma]|uniref:Uncharacterized protein n=1 Tax=Chlamydomonas eustigma TaxID=1157962 RepID=A0A250WRW4_9CHLO|nr:hypothetical protein CEUSTIGMA_g891.t1 [Chlamydomonas eustigma]|eukprot:GAX73439.1 hypothetical protein CEUSTIGMA_g891.t1 [Chlamydomonas eustigma]
MQDVEPEESSEVETPMDALDKEVQKRTTGRAKKAVTSLYKVLRGMRKKTGASSGDSDGELSTEPSGVLVSNSSGSKLYTLQENEYSWTSDQEESPSGLKGNPMTLDIIDMDRRTASRQWRRDDRLAVELGRDDLECSDGVETSAEPQDFTSIKAATNVLGRLSHATQAMLKDMKKSQGLTIEEATRKRMEEVKQRASILDAEEEDVSNRAEEGDVVGGGAGTTSGGSSPFTIPKVYVRKPLRLSPRSSMYVQVKSNSETSSNQLQEVRGMSETGPASDEQAGQEDINENRGVDEPVQAEENSSDKSLDGELDAQVSSLSMPETESGRAVTLLHSGRAVTLLHSGRAVTLLHSGRAVTLLHSGRGELETEDDVIRSRGVKEKVEASKTSILSGRKRVPKGIEAAPIHKGTKHPVSKVRDPVRGNPHRESRASIPGTVKEGVNVLSSQLPNSATLRSNAAAAGIIGQGNNASGSSAARQSSRYSFEEVKGAGQHAPSHVGISEPQEVAGQDFGVQRLCGPSLLEKSSLLEDRSPVFKSLLGMAHYLKVLPDLRPGTWESLAASKLEAEASMKAAKESQKQERRRNFVSYKDGAAWSNLGMKDDHTDYLDMEDVGAEPSQHSKGLVNLLGYVLAREEDGDSEDEKSTAAVVASGPPAPSAFSHASHLPYDQMASPDAQRNGSLSVPPLPVFPKLLPHVPIRWRSASGGVFNEVPDLQGFKSRSLVQLPPLAGRKNDSGGKEVGDSSQDGVEVRGHQRHHQHHRQQPRLDLTKNQTQSRPAASLLSSLDLLLLASEPSLPLIVAGSASPAGAASMLAGTGFLLTSASKAVAAAAPYPAILSPLSRRLAVKNGTRVLQNSRLCRMSIVPVQSSMLPQASSSCGGKTPLKI